ncbi:alpha-L-fucosidase [Micromonospora endophytica]|uniref:alpha-L-fucosidase n=3 Tax=Micromonospora endophytica TaxID=515350 RepID=A0A2W2CGB6_9ACTN|nr:alpha-L-fucosidase [Micromonospora endophytica]PZF91964.1 alpha-L-fucosidase [Micromonospora endophytica]BCJ62900.1 alpha-L-fucosidase [Micromonospora endophytica]
MSSLYRISRRRLLVASGAAGAAAATGLLAFRDPALATEGPQSYTATWASVDQHPPAATWFQDAKFGIYYHWGAFSVPAFANEWYPRNMYNNGSGENNHHRNTYGEPSAWPYHNFINGANDRSGRFVQFAPRLRSAGGNFDPNEWAQLFVDAGAKFAGPVAEHHDGFSMWNSQVNEWNSVARGPRLDLLKLHADAIRAKGLKLFVSLHHAFNFTGFYQWVPQQSTASLRKLYGQLSAAEEQQLWYDKLREVIDGYQPDIIWQDFNLPRIDESRRLQFLAYYFNRAVAWNKDVVTTYKDGLNNRGSVYDFERGGPAGIQVPYWLTDDSISSSSWSYTNGLGYYSTAAMLHSLIDRVSKNGNMVLNIAPMADGTIPAGQQTILRGIGDYLRRFGESIYATRAWSVFGEGPTQMGGGSFVTPRAGTNRDIRFTRSKDNQTLYVTVLGWPGSTLNVTTMTPARVNLSGLTGAQLLDATPGSYINLPRPTQDGSGLRITLPSANAPFSALAYVVKLNFGSGGTPSPTPTESPTAAPGGPATASYRITSSWSGGFQGEVTVTAGASPINGWTVTWSFPNGQSIQQIWNGTHTQSGSNVSVTNVSYNGALAARASTTFGFLASWNGTNNAPSNITVTTR